MINIKTILSDVQMDLGDNAHEAIQRAEYVDTINNILRKVALQTRIYIKRKIYQPNDGSNTDPVYQCRIAPEDAPVLLLTVYRSDDQQNWLECAEYGYETNMATLRGESTFIKNNGRLNKRHYHTQYMDEDTNQIDDGRYLIFNEPIKENEFVAVDFVSSNSVDVILWEDNMTLQVPDFLEDAIRYGVQWKLMERIFNRGNNKYESRAMLAKRNYDRYLKKARSIALNYLNIGDSMQIQPINYLPE